MQRVGEVAYRFDLPPELSVVYDVFHVSMLRKCLADASQIIPIQPEVYQEDLSFVEDLVQIIDQKEQVLRNKVIPLVLVRWQYHGTEEVTWEHEDAILAHYLYLSAYQ